MCAFAQVSRAIGDAGEKPFVSAEADVRRFGPLGNSDEFIILATDGLWDVLTSQEAVDFVHASLGAAQAAAVASCTGADKADAVARAVETARRGMAKALTAEAMRVGTTDNTSVVVQWLQQATPWLS